MDLASLDRILAFAGLMPQPSETSTSSPAAPAPLDDDLHLLAAAHFETPHARETFRRRVRTALELIESILALFPLESLALTFNGGKDACVVFYLVRAAVALAIRKKQMQFGQRSEEDVAAAMAAALRRLAVLYFVPKHGEFGEVSAFMEEVAAGTAKAGVGASGGGGSEGGEGGDSDVGAFAYTVYQCGYQEGMREMVDARGLKAVFMGVRSGDPYSLESEHVQPSSPGWPPFLRINAILKWDYGHVWTFLRAFRLPYCCLYDQGYTSIGDVRTTVRNPALLKPGALESPQGPGLDGLPNDPSLYLPAYELGDYTLERANRTPNPQPQQQQPPQSPKAPSPPPPQPQPQPPTPPIADESLDASSHSTCSAATEAATAAAAGLLKRGSFCERLPVALICVGDFLMHQDAAPLALAHELRELRCRVAPLALVPAGSPPMLAAQLEQTLRLLFDFMPAAVGRGGEEPPPPRVVFVLGIDDDAWAQCQEGITKLAGAANSLFLHPGKTPDAGVTAEWRDASTHVRACGDRVFLLGAAFARGGGVPLEAQKAELDGLLDSIMAASSSSSIPIQAADGPSTLPPDPVVAPTKRG